MELMGSYDASRNRLIDRQIARTEFICKDNAQKVWNDGQELTEGKDFLLEMVKDDETSLWHLQCTPILPGRKRMGGETESTEKLKRESIELHHGM